MNHNGLVLDLETRTVAVNGAQVGLTRSEFDLLGELLRGRGAVRSRVSLARAIKGEEERGVDVSESEERAVEVHIGNLRRKLNDDRQSPLWLQTVRGVGYRMAPNRQENSG